MSIQITTAFVDKFTRNFTMLSQQRGSKLRSAVMLKTGLVGKRCSMDQIGPVVATKRTTRHSDTQYTDTPHARRWLTLFDYDHADLIDVPDKVRMLDSPQSEYMQTIAYALGRAMDDEIISAFTDPATTGQDGTSSVAWAPSAFDGANSADQVFVPHDYAELGSVSSTGMTVDKLRTCKRILDSRDVPSSDEEERIFVCHPDQVSDLLNDEQAISSDFAAIKALVDGKINQYMGFTFKYLTRTKTVAQAYGSGAADERLCYAYCKSAMNLGVGADIQGKIDVLPTKRYSTQVFGSMTIGATRTEEDKIVEVRCQFPAATS